MWLYNHEYLKWNFDDIGKINFNVRHLENDRLLI